MQPICNDDFFWGGGRGTGFKATCFCAQYWYVVLGSEVLRCEHSQVTFDGIRFYPVCDLSDPPLMHLNPLVFRCTLYTCILEVYSCFLGVFPLE